MSNVAKLKKKAAEFEQKKQFDKALALYVQILESNDSLDEEADVALYNRVGDLMLRHGTVSDAVRYYERAVDLYAEGGFFNNAIALCNKILRHSPGRSSIYYKLGKISAKKGFKSDAKQNFLEYADRMQKAGQIDEAFRALKEFADLCPDQDDIRLMLAEQLSLKDRKGEALQQLQTLYDKFQIEGRGAEARATAERMRAIDPSIEPKASATPPQAKASDLIFLDLSYDEPELREVRNAATPITPMPAIEPSSPSIDDIALPFLDTTAPPGLTRADDAHPAFIEPIGDASPPLGLEATAFGTDAGSWPPATPESLPPVAFPSPVRDESTTPVDLSGGLVSFDAQPLNTSAFDALQLDSVEPGHSNPPAHDLALPGDLPLLHLPDPEPLAPELRFLDSGIDEPSAVESVSADQLSTDDWLLAKADSDLGTPTSHPRTYPSITEEQTGTTDDEVPEFTSASQDFPGASDLDFLDSPPSSESSVDRSERLSAFESDRAADERHPAELAPHAAPFVMAAAAYGDEPTGPSLASLRDSVQRDPANWLLRRELAEALLESGDRAGGLAELEVAMLGYERDHDVEGARSVATEIIHLEPNSVRHHQKRVEYAFHSNDKVLLAGAYLELADSLFRGAQPEMARAVYQRVLELAPDDSRAQAALSAFPTNTPPGVIPVRTPPASVGPIAAAAESLIAEPPSPEPPISEPAIPEPPISDQPMSEPARAAPAVAARQNASARSVRTDDEFVNLADWLRDEEPARSTRMIAEDEQRDAQQQADFGEMLRKFKQGVAANLGEEDHESHYDLGVAFKEMGLVDEAIAEFQKALRSTSNRVRSFEALGQCFLEKSQFQVAHTLLTRALSEPDADDQRLVGVLYLLGYAAEAMRRYDEAVGLYQRVFAVDIAFRDVGNRLSALERVAR